MSTDKPMWSYYGSLDPTVKPRYGVETMIANEYLKCSIDRECKKAAKNFVAMNESCRKNNTKDSDDIKLLIMNLKVEMRNFNKALSSLTKDIEFIVLNNSLKSNPKIKVLNKAS